MCVFICRSPLIQRRSRHSPLFINWFINCVSDGSYHLAMKPLEQRFTEEKCRTEYEGIMVLFNLTVSACAVPTGTCPGFWGWLL